MVGPAFAVLSGIGYGVSDFVGGLASRRVAALRVVLVSYPVALVLLTALAFAVGGHVSTPAIVWGGLCGLSQAFGVWWFYAALGTGPMSLVSPLTAILVAGVPIVAGVTLGERPSVLAYAGIALALIAVVLVSREVGDKDSTEHRFTTKVAWLTLGAGLAFGLNFVLIDQAPIEAQLWPLVFARLSASLMVLVIAVVSGNLAVPSGVPLKLALAAGVLDTISNVAMLLALHASMLSLTSVLISLYPAGTVGLALVVLKEKVTRWQAAGMALALMSVGMIAAGR
ncbi:DMT family transporter [Mycolicibacterium hodleri]|uniref:DMT family transporter n=1 Tax=Mycolicibacterium hodleri TaxID=49897 RepID=A0A502E8I5_9MYCO|nr:EamA family transporter [Mycolicibacterium hodleri]TPG32770.1 DMT family transporter [Mycolicibacterium hodleri]